jgi:hypothetical protein
MARTRLLIDGLAAETQTDADELGGALPADYSLPLAQYGFGSFLTLVRIAAAALVSSETMSVASSMTTGAASDIVPSPFVVISMTE